MTRPGLTFVNGPALPMRSARQGAVCHRPMMTTASAAHTLNGKKISGPIQPAGQNILVKIAEAADSTVGGLILAATAKEAPTYGEAIEVGPGKFFANGIRIPMSIAKGDIVLYGKYGGTDVDYDGEKHTILTQDDVLCTLAGGKYSAEAVNPIFDRVLVKVDDSAESTASGIILSKAKEKPTSGTVVAIGSGRFMENGETEPCAFAVGDSVLYGKYSGTAVQFDGVEYMLIRIADVYAKH